MSQTNNLINHYRNWLQFSNFYQIQLNQITRQPKEFINNSNYLFGAPLDESAKRTELIHAKPGDLRVDVPVWFGDLSSAKNRVAVFGREPRDTDSRFNIERVGDSVFGVPFGVDRWNHKSSIHRKPQNKYYRVFEEVINNKENFVLFSDAVKFFKMVSASNNAGENDVYAASHFKAHASMELSNLNEELSIIEPTHIIALGNQAYNALTGMLKGSYNVILVRHPSQGGAKIALETVAKLGLT